MLLEGDEVMLVVDEALVIRGDGLLCIEEVHEVAVHSS